MEPAYYYDEHVSCATKKQKIKYDWRAPIQNFMKKSVCRVSIDLIVRTYTKPIQTVRMAKP